MAQASARALQSSLSRLQVSQDSKASGKAKRAEPVDSWEDEADGSSDTEGHSTPGQGDNSPDPPPPTPSSPYFGSPPNLTSAALRTYPPYGLDGTPDSPLGSETLSPSRRGGDDDRRPEKSTAVASRMIAAGIGQRAPKRTEEQRKYDQAMKVQEKKKRDQAKEDAERQKREREKALKDVWGD